MDQRPKYKLINYKLLEKYIGVDLHTLDLTIDSQLVTSKAQATKEELDKLNFKNFTLLCFKGHYQESEEADHRMGKNICKSRSVKYPEYKELLHPQQQERENNLLFKISKGLRCFFKED